MAWADIPPLNSLRAFAVVADAGSYSRAGAELHVSHTAIIQQIKALESRLGVALVVRDGRGIKLTEEGHVLASHLAKGFCAIRDGVDALTGADLARPVQITTSPAFAASWLMPRIKDFQQRHPDIAMMLKPSAEIVELSPGGVDIAIRYGAGNWSGVEVTPLLLPDMVVVGARELLSGRETSDLAGLAELPWLQEMGTNEVAEWMQRRGIIPRRPIMITHMPGNLILDGVRRGDGLTYTARCFVDTDIQSGQLVVVFSERNAGGYYLVTRRDVLRPPVRAFVKWLKQQARNAAHP